MKTKVLKKKMRQAGYSCKELKDFLRIERTALYNKMYGYTSFTFYEAITLKKLLGLSYEELEDILLHWYVYKGERVWTFTLD